ncbi:unnamed protein product [Mucor fragilis]
MSAIINLLVSSPAAKDVNSLLFEYADCLIDQTLNQYETYKRQFLLELRLMEAIEHEHFKDASNILPIRAVHSYEEVEQFEINVEGYRCSIIEESQMQLGNENESQFTQVNDPIQQIIEQLLHNMKINDDENSGKEAIEAKLIELLSSLKLETPGGGYSEAILTERLSSLKLNTPEDELAMAEMAAAFAKLSLGVHPFDTFDRDLAVFDRDGNIMVQDSDIFTFLAKALLTQSSERDLLRRLLLSNQNE